VAATKVKRAEGTQTAVKAKPDLPWNLQVEPGTPPMKVNSQARVANLHAAFADDALTSSYTNNADKLDNKSSEDFAPSTHNHDAAYVNETDHTKAAHDALDIDADTLDGLNSTQFMGGNTYRASATIPGVAYETANRTATCNEGDKVLSGGFGDVGSADTVIVNSMPVQATLGSIAYSGWYVESRSGATADTVWVYALCADM
jgi:hypothetical protein